MQILAELLRAVYWFNPLLWLVCYRLRLDVIEFLDVAAAIGVDPLELLKRIDEASRLAGGEG